MPKAHYMGFLAFLLVTAGGCTGSIHDAVNRRDPELVARMLQTDPSLVNARTSREGKTPLHYAVTYCSIDVIPVLLDHGADINAADQTGLTPLHVAAMHDKQAEAEQLIARGANLASRDKFGDTPLHIAAMHGKTRMVEYLLTKGADAAAANENNATPLDLAKKYRRQDVIELFGQGGAAHE